MNIIYLVNSLIIQSYYHEIKPRISTFALHSPANSAIFLVAKVAPFLAPE